jgi:hypothetical protein
VGAGSVRRPDPHRRREQPRLPHGHDPSSGGLPDGSAVRANDYSGGTFDPPPDFAAQARAAGGFGARVDERADLVPTLREARAAVERQGCPAVIDVWLPPLV